MLKANAYGHGAVKIAKILDGLCEYFGVASIEEGIELCKSGIKKTKIIVFSGFFCIDMIEMLIHYQLIPVIHSRYQYEMLHKYFNNSKFPIEIWLKINTGMNRLGLPRDEFELIYKHAKYYNKSINLITHLSNAASANKSQLMYFQDLIKNKDFCHISAFNSVASLLETDDFGTNTIRIGIALYGITAIKKEYYLPHFKLAPVMSLHAHIIAIQSINPGDTVGYDQQYTAKSTTKIAVASIGYGDGYPEIAPNGTKVLIKDQLYPIAGKVSMDLITIDIGKYSNINIGDIVTLFGTHKLSINHIAEATGISNYSLITSINQLRVKRFYK